MEGDAGGGGIIRYTSRLTVWRMDAGDGVGRGGGEGGGFGVGLGAWGRWREGGRAPGGNEGGRAPGGKDTRWTEKRPQHIVKL